MNLFTNRVTLRYADTNVRPSVELLISTPSSPLTGQKARPKRSDRRDRLSDTVFFGGSVYFGGVGKWNKAVDRDRQPPVKHSFSVVPR